MTPTRLLYPVEQKNYSADPFIEHQWKVTTAFLRDAYYVTIYGYSAPTTDVEARRLLLDAWQGNPTRTLAEIDIVDIRDRDEVLTQWADFIVRNHGGVRPHFEHNILMRHARRSCESFAFATLQQDPWHEDPFPRSASLTELDEWIKPLLDEEKRGKLSSPPKGGAKRGRIRGGSK